ncbi:hypothetical protein K435DRAFT_769146 [Dendrothele bispora CBS 962.96]|uniref:ARM repeat-containing protein n=1 Tax=Dendrothele bispora (strain CBS 962.96) TaxID=1314807 RepID=A0A4S8KSI3_DENBC|nr:hypothetical protein K435DRAFT_769146 [Dendrothele bispora CBS 962.96]
MVEPTFLTRLSSFISSLRIPEEYSDQELSDAAIISKLNAWKDNTSRVLDDFRDLIKQAKPDGLSSQESANIIAATAVFDGQGPWIDPQARTLSREILAEFSEPDVSTLTHLLSQHVKPLFQSNPHPSLDLSSGRTLRRPAGGPMATQDFFESQVWKKNVGASNLVAWCVKHIKSEDYDRLWYLLIPPVMTLLDDYQAHYKLQGVQVVLELLKRAPKEVLKRTGLDGLLRTSLNTCLGQLESPETPALIRGAIEATLSLILLTTTPSSVQQFDQLCILLGEGLIGTVWLYSSEKPDVILASLEVLPPLVDALGLGCTRYLKALIPQLVHLLYPVPLRPTPVELQTNSIRALIRIINQCSPRIGTWKGTILDGVGRCWVNAMENPSPEDRSQRELKRLLQDACQALKKACPSVIEEEYQELFRLNHVLFQELVS